MVQRFQLYFPVELYLRLKDAAARQGTSIAAFVRVAAEKALTGVEKAGDNDPLDRVVGRGSSKDTDLSYRHDKYLYGWVKEKGRRKR